MEKQVMNTSVSFENVKEELLQDPEVKKEYDMLESRYEIIEQIIAIRKGQNMTQAQLARLVDTLLV